MNTTVSILGCPEKASQPAEPASRIDISTVHSWLNNFKLSFGEGEGRILINLTSYFFRCCCLSLSLINKCCVSLSVWQSDSLHTVSVRFQILFPFITEY